MCCTKSSRLGAKSTFTIFRGAAKTKPRLPNTCYAIFDLLSLFREQRRHECELYFGIHDSFQFEPSLRQCSEVAHSCLPVSLVAGSMAFMALLAAAMLEAGTCIDSEPSGSGSADSTCCIVPSFKIDFAPALVMRSIGHVPINKNSWRIFSRIVASPRNS